MADERDTVSASALRRDLGLWDAVGVGLGAVIGAGIFVVTGAAAAVAGPSFLVGLLLAGAAAACNALSAAQLAAAYPQSGGTYEYGYRVLHPWFGFAAGWMFLASKIAAGGTVALGFASYLTRLMPALPLRETAVTAVVLLTTLNYFGIKKVGRVNMLIVAATVLVLLVFAAVAAPAFRLANLRPFAPYGLRGILESAALLFFAYTGYARVATLGEEVSEPKRTIPRAIIVSLSIAGGLYLVVALAAVGAVGSEAMAASPFPLDRAARALRWPGAVLLIGIGAASAMLGVLLSQILAISRMLFAMGRRRDLPAAFDHVHSVFGVPDRGVLFTGLALILLSSFGTLDLLIAAASFTILLYYAITNYAALKMRPEDKLFPNWIPAVGFFLCIVLSVSLRPATVLSGLGILSTGLIFRASLRVFSKYPGDEGTAA